MSRPAYRLEVGFASPPSDLPSATTWVDITSRLDVRAGVKITRGRSDEQSDVQPSTMELVLDNRDGALTPNNPASPYWPNVTTGKRIRLGLFWPGGGKQWLQTDPSFEAGVGGATGAGFFGGPPPTLSLNLTHPDDGAQNLLATWGYPGQGLVSWTVDYLIVGQQYTASARVWVPVGSPDVQLGVAGITFGTVEPAKGTMTTVAVTFTATTTSHQVQLIGGVPSAAGKKCNIDSVQVELGPARTAFTAATGMFSWRFTGDVDEWPLAWAGGPALYAETKLTATDRLKRLGDLGEFAGTLEEDVLDDAPIAYYPLQETATADSAGDISGRAETPLTVYQVGSGGDLQFDQRESGGVGAFFDEDTTTVGFNPAGSNVDGKYLRATLRTPTAATSATGAGATVAAFGREGSVPPPTGPVAILTAADGSWFGITKVVSGNVTAAYYDAASGTLYNVVSGVGLTVDHAELYCAVLDIPSPGNARIRFYASNGAAYGTPVTFTLPGLPSWSQVSVGGRGKELFRGNLTHVAFFAAALPNNVMNGWWYSAIRGTDGAGSTTFGRLAKHCVYTGLGPLLYYNGGAGYTPQLAGGQQIRGQPVEAMRLLEDTEGGAAMFYLKGDGSALFQLRASRYNQPDALALSADRLDPDALSFRGDDFGLVNDVTVSSPQSGGATARVVNDASVAATGRRKASDQAVPATDGQARALAAWRANVGGVQRNRVTGLKVSLLNDPALVPAVLGLGLGARFTVSGLPGQAPGASLPLAVEGWAETIGETEWSVEFLASPGEVWNVWQIGVAGHNEIGITTIIAL